jgi:hypothetical protein
MGFPVDRLHVSGGPVVALHDILADSGEKCFSTDGAAVSEGDGLSLTV